MTSTPPPQQPGRPVVDVIRPLRDLAAYALVAAPAVLPSPGGGCGWLVTGVSLTDDE